MRYTLMLGAGLKSIEDTLTYEVSGLASVLRAASNV